MSQELRCVERDNELRLEGYLFQGHCQPFPPHFHDHYVVGLMGAGRRTLLCQGQSFLLTTGQLLLLSPGVTHSCAPEGENRMNYLSLALPADLLAQSGSPLTFRTPVVRDTVVERCLRRLHTMVMDGSQASQRHELLNLLLETLRTHCLPASPPTDTEDAVELVCHYLEDNYPHHITLEELCRLSGLSKSSLLRAFTRCKGITPYRYLENVRFGHARRLLEQGLPPVDAALNAGFSDQSHFTNFFTAFSGITPGAYQALFSSKCERQCNVMNDQEGDFQ